MKVRFSCRGEFSPETDSEYFKTMRESPKSLGTTVVSKWSNGRLVGPEKLSRSNKLDPDNFSSSKPIYLADMGRVQVSLKKFQVKLRALSNL